MPGNVQSITGKQIKDAHAVSVADLLNSQLQSVNVNDYQGNPFQMDVIYRGFTASPQIGTAQGLSVFLDGIRVNEPFGDVVNWDMIPMNALSSFDVFPGSNPIFGLGTLGGAFSTKTKNGFENSGVEAEVLAGSYGRKQFLMSAGANNGVIGGFLALNLFNEDGWRKNSPSKVNQIFGKASYRTESLDLNFSTLIASNDLVGNGLVPSQISSKDYAAVYTSPDESKNKLLQFQLSGLWDVSDTFNVTAQVYRRDSKRKASNGDVYTPDSQDTFTKSRKLNSGETPICMLPDADKNGLPDFYVDEQLPDGQGGWDNFGTQFVQDNIDKAGILTDFTSIISTFNMKLDDKFEAYLRSRFNNLLYLQTIAPGGKELPVLSSPDIDIGFGLIPQYNEDLLTFTAFTNPSDGVANYISDDGSKRYVLHFALPTNPGCFATDNTAYPDIRVGVMQDLTPTGSIQKRDGAADTSNSNTFGTASGVIDGTPTSIITNTQIDQITDGGAVQLNWNTDHHKFMVGASLDRSHAKFKSGQMLGLLDINRNSYLDPANIGPEFTAATQEIPNNNFEGTSTTKSLYFSETWSPVKAWHFTGAARYNDTTIGNALRVRNNADIPIGKIFNRIPNIKLQNPDGSYPAQAYYAPDVSLLKDAEKEKFNYYSLNPSLGATWQANESLNIYGNISKGARTPSVVELGCAFDKTPVVTYVNQDGTNQYSARSIAEHRVCNLPTTLSGDPYLPQVRSTSFDVGMRGKWGDNITWNLGAFRTNLKDDIYYVSVGPEQSFFDTIGKTRRQGLEAGIIGEIGKAKLRLNYSLTDATFQSSFNMLSPDNSSANFINPQATDIYGSIRVEPGNRMPGVPLHNLNASFDYDITPDWKMGVTAVMHSLSYVRGNENNKHQQGVRVARTKLFKVPDPNDPEKEIEVFASGFGLPTSNPGTVPGYAVFNFHTSYKLDKGLTLGLNVANLFDRKYYSAGRLGVNPFSPSVNGAIGVSGYNHNSNDWLAANFLAPGAPRGIWATLNYEFGAEK
ncbi:TonB-dependent receptor [Methylotenera sp.]|uniref:TonB-dependent receptor n=1 Tax=Methylotenera sp. TaxID=2051956 RepID=UPI0025E01F50|nr:TonB-dependent receptor [Methylotenera sp.]